MLVKLLVLTDSINHLNVVRNRIYFVQDDLPDLLIVEDVHLLPDFLLALKQQALTGS